MFYKIIDIPWVTETSECRRVYEAYSYLRRTILFVDDCEEMAGVEKLGLAIATIEGMDLCDAVRIALRILRGANPPSPSEHPQPEELDESPVSGNYYNCPEWAFTPTERKPGWQKSGGGWRKNASSKRES